MDPADASVDDDMSEVSRVCVVIALHANGKPLRSIGSACRAQEACAVPLQLPRQ